VIANRLGAVGAQYFQWMNVGYLRHAIHTNDIFFYRYFVPTALLAKSLKWLPNNGFSSKEVFVGLAPR